MKSKQNNQKTRSRIASASRKSAAVICAAALASCMTPTCALAAGNADGDHGDVDKTEVVYVKADANGNQIGVHVVNQFESDKDTTVRDAGTYESVKNLTDEQELNAAGTSKIKVKTNETYLYQGDLSADVALPWTVSVSYKLDGEEVNASELAGKSGELEMTLSVKPNKDYSGDYADNYLLQVSGALDNDLASEIKAPKATKAQASGSTQLSYMVFPGKKLTRHITAQVEDFEFDGWQVVGVPLAIALDIDDSDLGDASSNLGKLEDATASLDTGAGKLSSGVGKLTGSLGLFENGSSSLSSSLNKFSDSSSALVQGSKKYQSALDAKAKELNTKAGQVDVETAQASYAQAAQTYTGAFAQAFTKAYTTAYAQYVAAGMSASEAQAQAQQDAQSNAKEATASYYAAMQSSLKTLVTAQATQAGYQSAASALSEASQSYTELGQGINSYVSASKKLSDGATSLSQSASKLSSGSKTLATGASKLAEGASELHEQTDGISDKMIDEVRDKLEDYLNPSFTLKDFVNGSTEVENVQFVYKTDAIEIPDEETTETDEEDNRGFFEKLLALFGL